MDNKELIFEISELNSIGNIDLEWLNYSWSDKDYEEIEFEGLKYRIRLWFYRNGTERNNN